MSREQIGKVINTPPPKARVMVRRSFLRFAMDGFNNQQAIRFKHAPDFSQQLFCIESVVQRIGENDVRRFRRKLEVMKVAGEHERVVLAGVEIHSHREAAKIVESFYLRALPRAQAEHVRAFFQKGREPFLQKPPVFNIIVPEVEASKFRLLVANIFLIGGIFAPLELHFAGGGQPAIPRARPKEQNAQELPPAPRMKNLPQSFRVPGDLPGFGEYNLKHFIN